MAKRSEPVQHWGCTKCQFIYDSPVRLRVAPVHRCPPTSNRTASAVFLSGIDPKGTEPIKTKTGKVLSDADIQALADEAEKGYDLSKIKFTSRLIRGKR